jgi:hypothetical protein
MRYNDANLAIGTAFFYLLQEKSYLITNWHNVSGRNPNDFKPLSPSLGIPNYLEIAIPYSVKREDQIFVQWREVVLELYKSEKPVWYEHPVHGVKVDAVAISFEGIEETKVIAANHREKLDLENFTLRPSLDAFVLGYPLGITGGGKLPIWKRASIATEPDIDLDNLPKFLIDTATREGMSGSPVYAQVNGFFTPEDKPGIDNGIIGEGRRFIGIYSGRLGSDPIQAQLGIVWKEKAIEEIILGNRNGKSSFEI